MSRSELAAVIILRIVGIMALFAIPAMCLPFDWMNAIHGWLGLGELPDAPIVEYLARSLSGAYAILGVIMLYIASDIRANRALLRLWAVIQIVAGVALTVIDVDAGLPSSWTWTEGPPGVALGIVLLLLARRVRNPSPSVVHPAATV